MPKGLRDARPEREPEGRQDDNRLRRVRPREFRHFPAQHVFLTALADHRVLIKHEVTHQPYPLFGYQGLAVAVDEIELHGVRQFVLACLARVRINRQYSTLVVFIVGTEPQALLEARFEDGYPSSRPVGRRLKVSKSYLKEHASPEMKKQLDEAVLSGDETLARKLIRRIGKMDDGLEVPDDDDDLA